MTATQGSAPALPEGPGGASGRGCLRSRTLGCLVKTPLGCFSFLFGALVVVILFLPLTLGRMVGPQLEDWFNERHQGTLDFGEFRFSWIGEQEIDQIILKDPEGFYVADVRVLLPSMTDILGGLNDGSIGPIRVTVDGRVEVAEDGSSNLARALAPREIEPGRPSIQVGTPADEINVEGLEFLFEVFDSRLKWTNPLLLSGGGELEWKVEHGTFRIPPMGPGELLLEGMLDDFSRFDLDARIGESDGFFTGDLGLVDFTLGLKGVPSDRAREALELKLPLADLFGSEIGFLEFEVRELGSESPELTVDARWEGGLVFATGSLQDGRFVAPPNAKQPARIDFELRPCWAEAVVGPLLPFLEDVTPVAGGPPGLLELRAFTLPIEGGLEELSGTFRLHLGEVGYVLFPGNEEHFGEAGDTARDLPPFDLRVSGGMVFYEDVRIPTPAGDVRIDGSYDLVGDVMNLRLSVPTSQGEAKELFVTGPRGAPEVKQIESGD
ncbi:MAG: hypothetical protein O7B99_03915 [Planctomycetota bacterium]|nr:hypothetical protein [Planctomycetota bacterium]